jgi:monoterpene epsilon-lactone hydrolase
MDGGTVLTFDQVPDAVELRHLRAFVAVAEELNFGRAAARLYLSQPALSRQISTLERLIGCTLLRRSTHQVELTVAGDAMLECARRLLRDLDKGISATRSVGGELVGRAARAWAAFGDIASADLKNLRTIFEDLHGQFSPPPEVTMRPVNTGGVQALTLAPQGNPDATVLHVHGGANVMGSAFGYRALCGALALAAERTVVVPDYRLAPEHPFPAGLDDCLRTYVWMLEQGGAPERITLTGDSTGALMVMSMLITLREQDIPLPGGVALLCPGIDLTCKTFTLKADDELQPLMTLDQVRGFIDDYLAGHPMDDPVVSPLTADLTGMPPMLIQAATGDYLA